jgi:hypothetical protein
VSDQVSAPILRFEALCQMKRAAGRPQDLADVSNLEEIQKLKQQRGQTP